MSDSDRWYLQLEQLQDALGATTDVSKPSYELAISSSTEWIDSHCSDPERNIVRHFWRDDAPSARRYHADTPQVVNTGDFDDDSDVVVEIYQNGAWAPLAPDLWQAEPLVRINGAPFTRIVVLDYVTRFPTLLGPGVRVTARWGWAKVPKPVSQACQILSVAYMNGIKVVSTHDGYDIDSTGPTNPIAFAEHLLEPYLPPELTDPNMMPSVSRLPPRR